MPPLPFPWIRPRRSRLPTPCQLGRAGSGDLVGRSGGSSRPGCHRAYRPADGGASDPVHGLQRGKTPACRSVGRGFSGRRANGASASPPSLPLWRSAFGVQWFRHGERQIVGTVLGTGDDPSQTFGPGRRGRWRAEIDLMVREPIPTSGSRFSALRRASSIRSLTSGRTRSSALDSTMWRTRPPRPRSRRCGSASPTPCMKNRLTQRG